MSAESWPALFRPLQDQLSAEGSTLLIAERWAARLPHGHCHRRLTTGLVVPDQYAGVGAEDEMGHEVASTGPYPRPAGDWPYEPRFHIFGGRALPEGIEPLVPSWTASNRTVLYPDPGFLMTYGLVPRLITGDLSIHWDEPAHAVRDVVVVRPQARWEYPDESPAFVQARRDYLQDFATLRQRALIVFCWENHLVASDSEIERLMAGRADAEFTIAGARFRAQRNPESGLLHVEIWAHKQLLAPGPLPISVDRNDPGALRWPGFEHPVTDSTARGMIYGQSVFILDTVLGAYEGFSEYEIHPASGSVSYEDQWSVSDCERVGRDLIRVDLRGLYGSCPADVVRQWHHHAAERPMGDISFLRRVPNVATRAKRLVHGILDLGDVLAAVCGRAISEPISGRDCVKLDRTTLDREGWWTGPGVELVCRHLGPRMPLDQFLKRCTDLHKLLVEGLNERVLRRSLMAIGDEADVISEFGSLKLLARLTSLAGVVSCSALDLTRDGGQIVARIGAGGFEPALAELFALNELRQLGSHSSEESRAGRLEKALRTFGFDPSKAAGDYGSAADAVYDSAGACLSRAAQTLEALA